MEEIEFRIFTPEEANGITPNHIVFSLLIPSLIFVLIPYSQSLLDIGFAGLIISSALMIYFTITKHTKIQALKGNLDKKLVFKYDRICINEECYNLSNIRKIDFTIQDYFNQWQYSRDFNPARSNGNNNKLLLTLKNGETIELKFQLMYKDQVKKLKEHLIQYHKVGILHFLKLIDLLGIDNYEEIQKFKKTLSNHQSSPSL